MKVTEALQDKEVRSASHAIGILEEIENLEARRGPYSYSRLNTCNQQFKYKYIDEMDGAEITRFGRNEGSAIHDLFEVDVRMRIDRDQKDWAKPEDVVDELVHNKPEYEPHFEMMTERLKTFRTQFPIYPQNYVGSEEYLAVDFNMESTGYNDPDAWFRGQIDYIEADDEWVARITDFKNYPTIHSHNAINDISEDVGKQLMGYAALVMGNYPSIEEFHYEVYYAQFGCFRKSTEETPHGERKVYTYSRDFVEDVWWPRRQREMLAKERLPEDHFKPQPSRTSCQYCAYIEKCPWANQQADQEIMARDEQEAQEVMDELIVLEEKRARLKDALNAFARLQGVVENEDGAWYGYQEREKTNWNQKAVLKAASEEADTDDPEELLEYISRQFTLNKRSIDQFAKRLDGDTREFLEEEGKDVERTTRLRSSF